MKLIVRSLQHFIFCITILSISFSIQAQTPVQVAGTAAITASSSGNWSSPSTWGGTLPSNDDRVLIPNGVSIIVDGIISQEFKSIRIANGGTLSFATDVDTELRTEFLVSESDATFEIGSAANKVNAGVTARLVFAERSGTTVEFDPERYAPGAVLMGPTIMHGQDKTSWLALAVHPLVGETELILKSAPQGWQIGDQLAIAGTDINDFTSDEVVTITGISGSTISFSPALARDHKAPEQAPDLDVHVANLSRNVIITSENQSVTAISGDPYHKPRGHIMFMHNLNVDVRYVEANGIGRTDKSIILDDYEFPKLDREPRGYPRIDGGFTNPRGRYSFHFHRGGISPTLKAAHVEGCVVNNDPGWGYVNHSSRVDFVQNVSYNVVGGAFNTEAGNETGSFIENIAIRTYNPEEPMTTQPRPSPTVEEATNALADIREHRQDFAWQGDGFWLHSAGVSVIGNVVSGSTGHAYVYWTEALIENEIGFRTGEIDVHVPADEFPELNALLHQWKQEYPNFRLDVWFLQPRPFKDNIAYTLARGVHGYYMATEFHLNAGDEFNYTPDEYRDQLNFVFENTTLWNIRRRGFGFNHSADITIKDSRIVGYNSPQGILDTGPNPFPGILEDEPQVIAMDLDYFHNTLDWNLINNTIEGFSGQSIGIATPRNAKVLIQGGTFDNDGTDIQIKETNFRYEDGQFPSDWDAEPWRTLRLEGDIIFKNPKNNIVMAPQFHLTHEVQDGFGLLTGDTKMNQFFLLPDEIILNFGPFENEKLYFDAQEADFIPINEVTRCPLDSDGEWGCVEDEFVGLSNQELLEFMGFSFGRAITPENAISHPMIIGGKVVNATAVNTEETNGISEFELMQNYPNPFNPSTSIQYSIPASGVVTLEVFDTMGRRVALLVNNEQKKAGTHQLSFDASALSSGVYLYRLQAGDDVSIKKLTLIK